MTAPALNDSPQQLQIKLERLNRLYAMLSHINRAIVRAEVPQELYATACRIAVEHGAFSLAWVELVNPDTGREVPVAAAGAATVQEMKNIHDSVVGLCPAGHAVREERSVIVNDTRDDPSTAHWHSLTERWGIRAGAAFLLRREGRVVGAFCVAVNEPGFFKEAEIQLLDEVANDISYALDVMRREEQRLVAESKMQYLAYYDPQTGMPSRALFEERLIAACTEGRQVAVLVANLRRYHGVLQLLGPALGTEVIRILAAKLEAALPTLSMARVAEAEFALMLENPDGLPAAEETAWNVHRVLAEAVSVDSQEVFLDPFVGIAVCPQDGGAADTLKHAIVAAAPRHRDSSVVCRFYSTEMDEDSRHRFGLDAALRRALERNEFVLHYQPQVNLASGRLIGAEALLRWQRADQTLVAPQDFIPLLEDNGLIVAVGEWVLQEACRRARQWQDEGLPPFRMAVNLSVRQFQGSDIREMVRRALEQSKLAPEWLELEITEGIVLLDADSVIRTMHDLNGDGVSHALDDFGTGYSSLSYLQRLPVTRIKIDRSFVTNLTSSPSDAAIARAMVGMAHSLGLTVIAEGVETEGQLGFLRGLGCEEMQGYLFSRPLPADEFAALLRDGRSIPLQTNANKPERVLLIVDDEASIIASLNRLLRRHGYRILTTTSASEGFDLLATHPVGVVVCDQRMPGMTGTEFLRRVKELHPHIVRIVLSGYTELNSVIDAVNRGAVYKFLTKPWEDETLLESLDDAFRLYEIGHENRQMSQLLKEREES